VHLLIHAGLLSIIDGTHTHHTSSYANGKRLPSSVTRGDALAVHLPQMQEGVVIRQGRSYRVPDASPADLQAQQQCSQCIFTTLAIAAAVGATYALYVNESYYFAQQAAFGAAAGGVRTIFGPGGGEGTPPPADGALVHLASDDFTASVGDGAFGLRLPQAVKLERQTEYCQWQESSSTNCETCTRRNSDGEDEEYDCNCVQTFHYVKMWRSHRILSTFFDQPANHHNPQRDPYPSSSFVSTDTTVGGRYRA
jgi:hypothetical protein